MRVCNKKEKAEQGKISEEKKAPETGMELSPVFKETNRLRNGKNGVVTSCKNPTQKNFQFVKRN